MDEAIGKVKEVIANLDSRMMDLKVAAEQEIEDIKKSRQTLEDERIRFDQESKQIHQVLNEAEQVGHLDVKK